MPKDNRYKTVNILINGGHIKTFSEIFNYIPPSIVCKDFGTNYNRFTKLIDSPSNFKLRELYTIASFFEIEEDIMITLAHNQIKERRLNRRR